MLDWRARIGLLVPSGNQTIEPELYRYAPPGVAFHFTRIANYLDTEEELAAMADAAPGAATLLVHAGVNLIVFACTAASLLYGRGYDSKVAARIAHVTAIPVTTTSTAVVAALRAVNAQRLMVLTPYADWLNVRVSGFFEAEGFSVAGVCTIPEATTPAAIASISPNAIYRAARKLDVQTFDGLFLSCTDLRALEVIAPLEADLGRPVVSSNQATLWHCLRLVGIHDRLGRLGRLLDDEGR
jgi:maleate isomerase